MTARYRESCRTIYTLRVLLVSTYELGHQPLAVTSPARRLTDAGHEVRAMDLSVEPLSADHIAWADRIAVSVPMHTALRLAGPALEEIRTVSPLVPVALYGLYAGVGLDAAYQADAALVGEYETALVAWVADPAPGVTIDLSVQSYRAPRRDLLTGDYASLETRDGVKKAGYVEGSHGCRHRCRHCPIPSVYGGRFRIVDEDSVIEDIATMVGSGVEHVTFGDPDFFNGPAHSMRLLEKAHDAHPEVTFDVTIKVEHLLAHDDLLPRLASSGVIFVVSAFESTSGTVLTRLDKGHTPGDMHTVLRHCRAAGLEIHPTWLPFTPWTQLTDLPDIFSFLNSHGLFEVTEPVQLGLRLLVPPGSLVLDVDDVRWGGFDSEALSHRWANPDRSVDELQAVLASIAARGAGMDRRQTLVEMWRSALEAVGGDPEIAQIAPGEMRARITEPWFC